MIPAGWLLICFLLESLVKFYWNPLGGYEAMVHLKDYLGVGTADYIKKHLWSLMLLEVHNTNAVCSIRVY